MTPDIFNSLLEVLAGAFQFRNCWVLYEVKKVSGVDWRGVAFFAVWGFWNLFYYPHLNQWYSFVGQIFVFIANILWVTMALVYERRLKYGK